MELPRSLDWPYNFLMTFDLYHQISCSQANNFPVDLIDCANNCWQAGPLLWTLLRLSHTSFQINQAVSSKWITAVSNKSTSPLGHATSCELRAYSGYTLLSKFLKIVVAITHLPWQVCFLNPGVLEPDSCGADRLLSCIGYVSWDNWRETTTTASKQQFSARNWIDGMWYKAASSEVQVQL
jgi:hypothetical protein